MANLKEIRLRITSVKSTRQITSAMKMVSASKLRKAQEAVTQLRPYANKLHEILGHLGSAADGGSANIYADKRQEDSILFVIITSNKGLCGAFNANVVKRALTSAKENYPEQFEAGKIKFQIIGKKAGDILKAKKVAIDINRSDLNDQLTFDNVKEAAHDLMNSFSEKKYDKIVLFYNQFKNAASQILMEEQFLPISPVEDENPVQHDYIFEPSQEEITESLIPDSLKIQLYKAILDSVAAEHGARMTAMHQATDNASELIKDLTLTYNKARQASITNEILEIVSGANALEA